MRQVLATALLAVIFALSAPALAQDDVPPGGDVYGFGSVSLGVPELVGVKLGGFPIARLSVEAQYKSIVFNHIVGLGVTGYVLGETASHRPPEHALLVAGSLMLNPTLGELRLQSSGEELAAAIGVYTGYGYLADSGFLLRILAGAIALNDGGFAGGPSVTLELGWAF